MKVRAHGRGSGPGNLVHPTPATRPPATPPGSARPAFAGTAPRPARPGFRGLTSARRPHARSAFPGAGVRPAGGSLAPGFPGAARTPRGPGPRPSITCGRDSTPTITAIGLTRATFAKRLPTWREVMTAPTQTTGAGSGARRRLQPAIAKIPRGASSRPPDSRAATRPAAPSGRRRRPPAPPPTSPDAGPGPGGAPAPKGPQAVIAGSTRDSASPLPWSPRPCFPLAIGNPSPVPVGRRLKPPLRRRPVGACRGRCAQPTQGATDRNTPKKNLAFAVANSGAHGYPCPNLSCTGFASADTGERSHDGHQDHHHVRLGPGSVRD
jgi:hypothetical protein